jgi:hypothetical protein
MNVRRKTVISCGWLASFVAHVFHWSGLRYMIREFAAVSDWKDGGSMCRVLLSLLVCALCSASTYGDARAKDARRVTVTGCTYEREEGCHYLLANAGQGYESYELAPEFWVPMPPPNRIVRVVGVIKPKHGGFCTAPQAFVASKIKVTDQPCRVRSRRKSSR